MFFFIKKEVKSNQNKYQKKILGKFEVRIRKGIYLIKAILSL